MLVLRSGIALLILIAAPPATATEAGGQYASGVEFHDRNHNGAHDAFDFGIRGVAVSNGRDVVLTDWRGRYQIAVDDDTIVFVIKPGGWSTPVGDNGIPRFYYIHKPRGSPTDLAYPGVSPTGPLPDRIDFPLYRQREPHPFRMILFADTQPYTLDELTLLNRDIIEQVIRNHDLNTHAETDRHSDETFERVYGPPTYAFSYEKVHFIVLDDVVYDGPKDEIGIPHATMRCGGKPTRTPATWLPSSAISRETHDSEFSCQPQSNLRIYGWAPFPRSRRPAPTRSKCARPTGTARYSARIR